MNTHAMCAHTVRINLHDRHHRNHLFFALTVGLAEVAVIVVVHEIFVHLLFVAGVLGRDVVASLLTD